MARRYCLRWNIRWFGKTERTDESLWYITEILSRFDLIAIQEVNVICGILTRSVIYSVRGGAISLPMRPKAAAATTSVWRSCSIVARSGSVEWPASSSFLQ